jgi:NAD(P)-dependent dehydrogenase (short-subunit alcohol dehydrogenase family)
MQDLNGRMAFVTGGASGIGLGMARAFASAGMVLALADRDDEALERATAELSKVTKTVGYHLDVSDRALYAEVADRAEADLGPVTVLCNNAAAGVEVPITRISYEIWDAQLNVTLGGQVNGVQTFVPRMIERGAGGHIVDTSSQAGLAVSHGGRKFAYNMAKFGIAGLTEALRLVLEPYGIGVTLLAPGYVNTNAPANGRRSIIASGLPEDLKEQLLARNSQLSGTMDSLGRSPDDVGREVLEAIIANRPYVHTARRADEVAARAKAIIDSMPPETDHDRALAAFVAH